MANEDDFASVIETAQRMPSSREDIPTDVVNLFENPTPPDHRVVRNARGKKIEGAVEYDYKSHVEFFQIPDDAKAYESVLDEILNAEAILRYEDRTFTKEGDCVVVLCYLTRKVNEEKTEKKQRAADDAEREEIIGKR